MQPTNISAQNEKRNPALSVADIGDFIIRLNSHIIGSCRAAGFDDEKVAGPWELLVTHAGMSAMQRASGTYQGPDSSSPSKPYSIEDLKAALKPAAFERDYPHDYATAGRNSPQGFEEQLMDEIMTRIETLRLRLCVRQQMQESFATDIRSR